MSIFRKIMTLSMLLASLLAFFPGAALAVETPVLVSKTFRNNILSDARQIIRTSTGRLYYFSGNGGHTTLFDGWVDTHTSVDGSSWSKAGSYDQHYVGSNISVAVDSKNVVHMASYDWNSHPLYQKFNTGDSPKADHSIEGTELLDGVNSAGVRTCSLAVDANDVPHVLYEVIESYKGKSITTLTYANRIGGVWNKIALWPKTSSASVSGTISVAVGPDNIPYVMMGSRMLKGNANNPTAFETMNLGGGYSFVIHQNGDVRVALSSNGNYANYVHDHAQPWTSGWGLQDSLNPDHGGNLVLSEDIPYLVTLEPDGLKTRKWFEPPVVLAPAPSGYTWNSLTGRWSFYNHHQPWLIDIGTRTWISSDGNYYWYTRQATRTVAAFSASPISGLAPLSVLFDNESRALDGQFITSSAWDFDNNGTMDSIAANPSHVYDVPGRYSVSLSVTDSAGASDTRVLKDYIIVDKDSDGDSVYDSRDNCPFVYNPSQNDIDGDGIGDACSSRNDILATAGLIKSLSKVTSVDKTATVVTTTLKDGIFNQPVRLEKLKAGYSVVYIRSAAEASKIFSASLRLYLNAAASATAQQIQIYPYARDGVTPLATPVSTITVTAGWNTVDVTPLVRAMNGFGFVKLRLAASTGWAEISEASLEAVPYAEWSAAISATALDFGTPELGSDAYRSLTVTNNGSGHLIIGTVTVPALPFNISSDSCSGKSIASGQSCRVDLLFKPNAAGTFSSAITISTNDPAHATTIVPLTGSTTPSAAISGTVTDQATGLPLSGVQVSLDLAGVKSKDPADMKYLCNNTNELTAQEYSLVANNDSQKFSCSGGIIFKVRNPYGKDPFSVSWNGVGAKSTGTEYLAQRFRPAKSGKLTKVSIDSGWFSSKTFGGVHVILKSSLGGDRGNYLAISNSNSFDIIRSQTTTWIDFTFPEPPQVTAGTDYYLEINGTYFESGEFLGLPVTSLYNLPWLSANSYPNGKAFQRNGGLWAELATSLAFSTFVDDQPDIVTSASTASLSMYGGNVVSVSAALLDPASGNPVRGIRMPNWAMGSDGQQGFNGDDMTVNERIDDCPSCYNSNRWLTVMFSSHSNTSDPLYGESGASALVTDQFALTFNRTLTATTDADGRYSFSELPGSAYSIRCNKPGYYGSVAGSLATGEQKNLDMQLISIPLLSVSITSPLDGATYNYARSVTVTGNVSNNASVTVNGVAAAVSNGVYTASVYIADGATMITANATDQYGQAATTSITVTVPLPPQISSISTSGITTDSAVIRWVTDQPATSAVAYGESSSYDKSVFANTPATNHEINISALKPSTTYHFMVVSTNAYGRTSSSADLVLTTPRFSAKSIGDIGNVAVVEVSGDYNADAPDCLVYTPPRQEIAKEYIRTHGDNYDFLVFLTNFDYAMRESNVKGFYIEAKNDTAGIGNVLFDRSAEFGSLGKLQGTIDMGNVLPLAANPYGPRLDQMITTLSHELMHRWGAHAVFKDPDGSANFGLLGQDNTHWSYLLDTKGSIMYGNGWRNNKDGTFTSTSIMSGYSPLDLYLMGMIDKSRVPPMLLIDNPAIDKTKLPELGATISGTAKTVTIEDIVAALGERIPNAATSPKKFNIGFVLLTRPGASAGNAPAAIETIRSAWAGRFAELTQGISGINGVAPSLNLNIDTPADNATNTGPDVTVTGTVINSTGAETGIMVNGIPATITGSRFIANRVPLQEGSNTISITATDANGLTATATRNVTAQAGHYLRITTNIDSGTGPLDVSFRINGSFSSTSYVRSATGPVPVSIIPGQSPEEFSARLSAEGNYTFTASATGPDGQMCSDSVTVTVISKAQLEMLLQGKWEGLNAKLMSKDLEGALSYLISPIQNDYRTELSRYLDKLPLLAQNMPDIELVYSSENRAKTRLFREETIKGQKMVIGYPVYYIRENGIWKLLNF